ncbi:hypothetical protein WR25_04318 [Diploscapter pachys]|uniref:Uncharacterized protein n=1 Tax=Diploscapter pachys TaxID=2018661 RepID=A0A2A2JJ33_9BILA|nr:hypothetical protein WR25_04318 [Diploscapter pachys]
MLGHFLVVGFVLVASAVFLPAFALLAVFNAFLPTLPTIDEPLSTIAFIPQAALVLFGAFVSLMIYSDFAFGAAIAYADKAAAFYETRTNR